MGQVSNRGERRKRRRSMDIVRTVIAAVHHSRDEDVGETYCLQIELGNDYGITFTVSENDPPKVSLWIGENATEDFRDETLNGFRRFVADAFEPQPPK
jgi:hypothetical protein